MSRNHDYDSPYIQHESVRGAYSNGIPISRIREQFFPSRCNRWVYNYFRYHGFPLRKPGTSRARNRGYYASINLPSGMQYKMKKSEHQEMVKDALGHLGEVWMAEWVLNKHPLLRESQKEDLSPEEFFGDFPAINDTASQS